MEQKKMNKKGKGKEGEDNFTDIEDYTLIDYSMSDVQSIIDPFLLEKEDSAEKNNIFINVWSVPLGNLSKENEDKNYDDSFLST